MNVQTLARIERTGRVSTVVVLPVASGLNVQAALLAHSPINWLFAMAGMTVWTVNMWRESR